MNQLPLAKRVQILNMLVESSSMRAISRVAGVSFNTVNKLLVDASETCLDLHDQLVTHVKSRYVQCDEIWSDKGRWIRMLRRHQGAGFRLLTAKLFFRFQTEAVPQAVSRKE